MKKLIAFILALSFMLLTSQAQARDNGVDGLLFGAGSGALIGQAIGKNTEATLIGTAVGSMLGYIVGNEMDKSGVESRVTYRRPPETRHYPRTRYVEVVPEYKEPICRETEMLAEIDGRPEKIYGTACLENGEWVVASPGLVSQTVIIEKNRRHNHKRNSHYKRAKHRKAYRYYQRPFYRPVW